VWVFPLFRLDLLVAAIVFYHVKDGDCIYYLITWLLKFWCSHSKELTGRVSACSRNMSGPKPSTGAWQQGAPGGRTQQMASDFILFLLYLSSLLSHVQDAFIKWKLSWKPLVWQRWHFGGHWLLACISWGNLRTYRLSLWFLVGGICWLLPALATLKEMCVSWEEEGMGPWTYRSCKFFLNINVKSGVRTCCNRASWTRHWLRKYRGAGKWKSTYTASMRF
jgi:hypothetical protein